jgi:hypothetical protein
MSGITDTGTGNAVFRLGQVLGSLHRMDRELLHQFA